jgi:hypothetical protein
MILWTDHIMTDERNPFPPSGVTRPGIPVESIASIPSQGGALERLEQAIGSVVTHGVVPTIDDRGIEVLKGKAEFFWLRGEFGSGKSFVLNALFQDCKNRKLRVKQAQASRKALVLAVYQPLHALVAEPSKFLDVLIERITEAAPTREIKDAIVEARGTYEKSIREKDETLKKILIWNYCCDTAIRNGIDAIVLLLDELEESVTDYDALKSSYAEIFSVLRELTDRQIGPVVTIVGITPKAIDSLIEKTKQALLRRAIIIDLPRLTSVKEFVVLAKTYDSDLESHVDGPALEAIFTLTGGNPGFGLASLQWAWEEMRYREIPRISRQLASEAVANIGWKGQKVLAPQLSFEVEARYPSARRALDKTRETIRELSPQQVIQGTISALNSIGILKEPQGITESLETAFGNRGDVTGAMAEVGLSLYSEPNVQYSLLIFYGQDRKPDEESLKRLLTAWHEVEGDLCLALAPSSAADFRRSIDRISSVLPDHKGIPMREAVMTLFLDESDLLEFAGLANMQGSIMEIKSAQKLVFEKYKLGQILEDKIRQFRDIGRTIPYRWEVKQVTKEVQWGIYRLLAKRFLERELVPKEAVAFVLDHYQLDEEARKWYDEVRPNLDQTTFLEKVNREVIGVLETLVDQGFAVKHGDTFFIPPLLSYEKQLHAEVKRIKIKESKNPGYDDLKHVFFGYVPKGNNIYGLARGMEGKGYIKCISLGPRRFYTTMDPDERYSQVQLELKNLRQSLQDEISRKFAGRLDQINPELPSELTDHCISSAGKEIIGIEQRLQTPLSRGADEFQGLRLASDAETDLLILIDKGVILAESYLQLELEVRNGILDVGRFDKVLTEFENRNIGKETLTKIRRVLESANKVGSQALTALKQFRMDEAHKLTGRLLDERKSIESIMAEEFREVAVAEKSLRIAIENFEQIEEIARSKLAQSKLLGIDLEIEKLNQYIQQSKHAIATGRFDEVKTEPLAIFYRRILEPKMRYVPERIALLKRATQLLVDLGQSPLADEVEMSLRRIEKEYERAVGPNKRTDDLIDHMATAFEKLQTLDKVFERLKTLASGAVRMKRSEFKTKGVDKAVAEALNIELDRAKQLRHVLEDVRAVKCLDIEIEA